MTTAVEFLTAARELVARPGGWIQGEYELDCAAGICVCAKGAFEHVGPSGYNRDDEDVKAYGNAVNAFRLAIEEPHIENWNDKRGRTQAEVVVAFDRAIELVKVTA